MPETPGLAEPVYEVKGRDFLPAEVLTKPVCPAHIGPTMDLSAVAVPAVRLGGRPTCHRCAGCWWWWRCAITRCGSIRRRGAAKEGTDGGRDDRGGEELPPLHWVFALPFSRWLLIIQVVACPGHPPCECDTLPLSQSLTGSRNLRRDNPLAALLTYAPTVPASLP